LNCRRRIQQYLAENDIGDLEPLTRHDWKILEKMHSVLHCYYEATLCNEGKDDHIGRWFSTMDYLLSKTWDAVCEFRRLETENPHQPEYTFLAAAANNAWLKCEQYYKRADETAAYYAAEVLQPSRKWSWLHQEWADDTVKGPWLAAAKNAVQQFWEEEYRGKFATPQLGTSLVSRPRHPDDEFGSLSEHRRIKAAKPPASDTYQSFIDRDPEGQATDDPLDYWNSRMASQPDLARFAFDMLALPPTSAECERVFSSAKLLITASRNRPLPDIIEANECLRSWIGKSEKSKDRVEQDRGEAGDGDWGSGEGSGDESGDESGDDGSDEETDESSEGESDGESDF
jgi:hAT family protein